jgi:hypothetical protein
VLNKNLEIKMRALLNGRILKNIKVFKNFEIDFLSDITKQFKKQTFALDDNIIVVRIINYHNNEYRKETQVELCIS